MQINELTHSQWSVPISAHFNVVTEQAEYLPGCAVVVLGVVPSILFIVSFFFCNCHNACLKTEHHQNNDKAL